MDLETTFTQADGGYIPVIRHRGKALWSGENHKSLGDARDEANRKIAEVLGALFA